MIFTNTLFYFFLILAVFFINDNNGIQNRVIILNVYVKVNNSKCPGNKAN